MKQSGNTIQNANAQEFLDSAKNAAAYGQRQFYTPEDVARALFRPLPAVRRHLIADLHFGAGALAAASGAETALGLDIDARVKSKLKPPSVSSSSLASSSLASCVSSWHVEQADLTRWYGVAVEADLRLPFIAINPPFSLQWYSDRLKPLADSAIPEVAAAYKSAGETIDSTLASFLIALDRLGQRGEGFMICNGNTAKRFFGDPSSPDHCSLITSSLSKYLYLWLEIPAMIFDNQMSDFPTAVLYFSRSHGEALPLITAHCSLGTNTPLFLRASSGDPRSIEAALMIPEVFTAHRGSRYQYEHEIGARNVVEKFRAIAKEYGQRFKGHKPDWNIRIDEHGRLRTWLTPFQEVSKRIHPQTLQRLHELNLQTPIALCVTATSRTALRDAVECGIWRIQPAVHAAIQAAMADFDAQGAPFYTPSAVQALGWVDEHSALTCRSAGIGTCLPGDSCPITCTIEPTEWTGSKINLAGNPEDLAFSGKELLVKLTAPDGGQHHFHVRKDDAVASDQSAEPERSGDSRRQISDQKRRGGTSSSQLSTLNSQPKIRHWHIADLIEHFHIPIPKDIVTLRPQEYAANLALIATIEARVNENLAKVV